MYLALDRGVPPLERGKFDALFYESRPRDVVGVNKTLE